MCGEFGINRRRAGHDHCRHSRTDNNNNNNNNIKGWKKKSKRKTSRCPHTLTGSWSLGTAAQTHRTATMTKDGDRSEENKRSSRLSRSLNHSKATPMTENNTTLKRPALFPSLQCLQQQQCVSGVHDVKRTTVRALWWRIVYWSGSLCLCKRFDIHATSPPSRWEGKLLFLAPSPLAVRVFISVHTRARSAQGCTCNSALLLCWRQLKACS